MKFVLCHVCSLVTAFGCLAVLSNSALLADEKEGKEIEVEAKVVVVSDGEGEENIAEAIKKALREKMDGLPEDVRKKIEAKVQAIPAKKLTEAKRRIQLKLDGMPEDLRKNLNQIQLLSSDELTDDLKKRIQVKLGEAKKAASKMGGEVKVHAKAIIVSDNGETKVIELDGKDLTASSKAQPQKKLLQTYRVQADTTTDGKAQVHVIRLDGEKDPKQNVLLFGGKPHAHDAHAHEAHAIRIHKADGDDKQIRVVVVKSDNEEAAKHEGPKTITVEVKGDRIILNGKAIETDVLKNVSESAKKRIQVRMKKEGDEGEKKEVRRRVMFLGKDGEAKELDIDVDVIKEGHNVWVEKAHDAMKKHHVEITKKHAAAVKEMAAKHTAMVKKLHAAHVEVEKKQSDHAHAANSMGKQLKEIKAELVKIRKLLEEIEEDDD